MAKKQSRIFFMLALVGAIALAGPQLVRADAGDDETATPGCNASAKCYQTTWNSTTNKWEDKEVGGVGCTGDKSCSSGAEWVECDGVRGECKI